MECPECSNKTKVLDTRKYSGAVYRKRKCKSCGFTFWTEEIELDKNADIIKTVQATYRMRSRDRARNSYKLF